jgi:hypothetical protein
VKYGRSIALVAGGLIAGLTVGSLGLAFAAGPTAGVANPVGVAQQCVSGGLKMGAQFKAQGARLIDQVAKLTGLSTAEVAKERAAGKSLGSIAASKGVSADAAVAATLAARKALLDKYVADGKITAAQEKAMLDRMAARMKDRVNSTAKPGKGAGAGCGMGGGQGGGQGGCQGGGCGATGTGAATGAVN